jgi:hypothetical protein
LTGWTDGFTGIELSISGLDPTAAPVVFAHDLTQPPSVVSIGSWPAPTPPAQFGGINVAWSGCVYGSQALFALYIQWISPIAPADHVLEVRHRYPPTNPLYGLNPVMVDCNPPKAQQPFYSAIPIRGARYVLNPTVHADSRTWSSVKGLYR